MAYKAMDIVNAFIKIATKNNKPLTQLSLHKLIYIAHAFSLVVKDKLLIEDVFEAWQYGPVIPEVYAKLKGFGKEPIIGTVSDSGIKLDDCSNKIIDFVYKVFADINAFDLVAFTHVQGGAWEKARKAHRDYILKEDIKAEYEALFPKKSYDHILEC